MFMEWWVNELTHQCADYVCIDHRHIGSIGQLSDMLAVCLNEHVSACSFAVSQASDLAFLLVACSLRGL